MAVSPRFELELSGPKPLVLPLHHETALIRIQLHTVAQKYGKSSVYADLFYIFPAGQQKEYPPAEIGPVEKE